MNKKIFLTFSLALLANGTALNALTAVQIGETKKQVEDLLDTDDKDWNASLENKIDKLIGDIEATKLEKTWTRLQRKQLGKKGKLVSKIKTMRVGQEITTRRAGAAEEQVAQLTKDLAAAEEESANFEKELAAKEEAVEILDKNFENLAAESAQTEKNMRDKLKKVRESKGKAQTDLRNQIVSLKRQLKQQNEQAGLKAQMISSQNREIIAKLEAQIKAQQDLIAKLSRDLETSNLKGADLDNAKKQLAKQNTAISHLIDQRDGLKRAIDEIERRQKAKEKEADDLGKEADEIPEEIAGEPSAAAPTPSASIVGGATPIKTEGGPASPALHAESTETFDHIYRYAVKILALPQESETEKKRFVEEVTTLYNQLTLSFKEDSEIRQVHNTFETPDKLDNKVATAWVLVGSIKEFAEKKLQADAARKQVPARITALENMPRTNAEQIKAFVTAVKKLYNEVIKGSKEDITIKGQYDFVDAIFKYDAGADRDATELLRQIKAKVAGSKESQGPSEKEKLLSQIKQDLERLSNLEGESFSTAAANIKTRVQARLDFSRRIIVTAPQMRLVTIDKKEIEELGDLLTVALTAFEKADAFSPNLTATATAKQKSVELLNRIKTLLDCVYLN